MPQLALTAGAVGGASILGAYAAGTAITAATFVTPFVTTLAAGFIGQILTPFPSSLNADVVGQQVQTKSTVAPRRYVMGRCMLSGANLTYAESAGAGGEYMHTVIPLCEGPITAIDDIYFDDTLIGTRDGDGYIADGTFATGSMPLIESWARVHAYLGETTQTADAMLVSESAGNWTTNHRGRGVAALVSRFERNPTLFASVPNQRVIVRGIAAYDPRDAATRYTTNPALLVRWYLTLAAPDGPAVDSSRIDDTAFAAAANICDERVTVDTYTSPAVTAGTSTDVLTFADDELLIGQGDGVRVLTTGTAPGGLATATTYYAIRLDRRRIKLSTSYANAMAGTAIDLTSAGTGTHTLSHIDQARYTCNGVFDTSQDPRQVLTAMLSTMSGVLYYAEGLIQIKAGAWTAPTDTLDAGDLAGTVRVQSGPDGQESYNGVRGTYVDPLQEFLSTDFPLYSSATYLSEDGSVRAVKDFDLQYVDNPIRAQRLAKIQLERSRRGRILTAVCKLSAYRLALWETVTVNLPDQQIDGDTFRVVNLRLRFDGAWVVVITLQEEDSGVWSWVAADASSLTPAPPLVLPNVRAPVAPASYGISSGTAELLRGTDGTITSRMLITWASPAEPNALGVEVQFKRTSDSIWTATPVVPLPDLSTHVGPCEDGVAYDVRIRTVTLMGAHSEWVPNGHTVVGKSAAPTAPSSLGVTSVVEGLDWSWSQCTEVDYGVSELWVATTNNRASATQVWAGKGNRVSQSGLTGGDVRYGWVRHVDTSGNASTYYPSSATGGVSGTAGDVDVQQITHDFTGFLAGGASAYLTGAGYWLGYASGYKMHLGNPSGNYFAFDGTNMIVAGALLTKALTVDSTGDIRVGASGYLTGTGVWLGYAGGAYKFHVGDPGGQHVKWDGSTFTIAGGVVAGSVSVNSSGSIAIGATGYLVGTGIWQGYDSSAYKLHIGNPSGAHLKWDGSTLTIKGSTVTGDIQVDASGNVRGGQTAYNTGTGFWLGYSGGAYKFSIGDPAGNSMRWDGTTLTISGNVSDQRPFAAGTNVVHAGFTVRALAGSAATWAKYKSIRVPRAGVLRASWTVNAGTTGSNTKTRIYVNGATAGTEQTTTTLTPTTYTDDITVAAGDSIELWGWWQIVAGSVQDFTLGNAFNENQFITLQD